MSGGAKKLTKKSSNKSSDIMLGDADIMLGGASTGAKKSSKKMYGGPKKATNPGFQAFLDLKKNIANKLKVSNSPKVGKVAGAVLREIKEKFKDMSSVDMAKKAFELFNTNVSKYEKMM